MALRPREAAPEAQHTLLALEHAATYPWDAVITAASDDSTVRAQSVPLVRACGGGAEAAFILSQGAIKVLRFAEIILPLSKSAGCHLSLIPGPGSS